MARARNIKPGVMENEDLAELAPIARLLFIYLWMLADREGRLEDRPKKIKAKALAYDDGVDADELLKDLQVGGFIIRYEVDGGKYIQIINFLKHQKPHSNEVDSDLPPCNEELYTKEKSSFDQADKDCEPDAKALGPCISDSLIDRLTDPGLTDSLIPAETRLPPAAPEAAPKKSQAAKPAVPTSETWGAYATAYEARYSTQPVRNATVNGQMANFVKRLGIEEAPAVAAWYVSHNNRYYVQVCHSVAAMTKDAEKLRTEWVRRRQVTAAEAQQADKTQTNFNAFAPLIEAAKQREAREASNA
ncbi:hypothetical protein PQR71_42135 [Paraburkholderia fungorum]|uniref:hypothetical protein n=1 Tax=Paraburkholderia fungorum TaxID=134537 RepID=UPI0038B7BDD0